MPAAYILACKEINGSVYVTRMPQTVSSTQPGVPDVWHFVGPGARPSIQVYSGTQYILTFEYLSHLFCRVVDTATWPPTQVNPVQVSGGPNPPTPFTYNFQLLQDSLTAKQEGQSSTAVVDDYFNPPLLPQPSLFLDAFTNTYSVTVSELSTWEPWQPTPNAASVLFRFYARPFPYTGSWVLVQDWTPINTFLGSPVRPYFSFPFSNVGSLRYQFSVTWGDGVNAQHPWNPVLHNEGIPGQTTVTVDSNTQHANTQLFLDESLTLKYASSVAFAGFDTREAFLNEGPDDAIQLSKSSLEAGNGNTFSFFDVRQAFVNEAGADEITLSLSQELATGGNALPAWMGN